jgi:urease alpha subunit
LINKNAQKPLSGIYSAKTIVSQATQVINNQEILNTQGGNQSHHVSLINNQEIQKALFTWASSQLPGEVSFSGLFSFTLY